MEQEISREAIYEAPTIIQMSCDGGLDRGHSNGVVRSGQ